MKRPSDLSALTIFTGAQILAEHPDGLRGRELWPLVIERLPDIEGQWANVSSGTTPLRRNFEYYTTNLVKAGWLLKSGGHWDITPVGRAALREYPEPSAFFERSAALYWEWRQNKERFELARQLVEAIPVGNWVAVWDLAHETGLEPSRLVPLP